MWANQQKPMLLDRHTNNKGGQNHKRYNIYFVQTHIMLTENSNRFLSKTNFFFFHSLFAGALVVALVWRRFSGLCRIILRFMLIKMFSRVYLWNTIFFLVCVCFLNVKWIFLLWFWSVCFFLPFLVFSKKNTFHGVIEEDPLWSKSVHKTINFIIVAVSEICNCYPW